ncbi:hypothetical protein SAMN02745150_01109 [Brevinema andersonii]|uniref:Flagellar motility protein MotE, a chaperone for MotC folding n=1 Tax=Brevinema andersonii TaxID=34097 RepID=A0A1I1EGG7_BREAD|nr:hypothetical protein [Brevinema andersonii]SFB86215.1 hypothetical protein SAMN02745150_01109 [Brevinema andersonii]
MQIWYKVFLLLLLNVAIAGFALYFFDFMRIIDYRTLFADTAKLTLKVSHKIEDPLLLEKEELNKKWELLAIKETEISNKNSSLELNILALDGEKNKLLEEREAFLNEQAAAALKKEEESAYDKRIAEIAVQIAGMPPQTAAEILNLQDDLQVVDTFRKMDELAAMNGQASTVPFLLTLLNREKAARVQALMLAAAQ